MLCPYCKAGLLRADSVTIAVRRRERVVREVQVAAWRCRNCGERSFSDDVVERAVQTLEAHTREGDEIVVIDEGETAGSA
jgi:YgiT-type zinc finger domain-containing protein